MKIFLIVALFVISSVQSTHAESWSAWESGDEMDGTISRGATSAWTAPTHTLPFPYGGLKGVAGFSCRDDEPWVFYLAFTQSLNLTGDESRGGYNELRTRIKFDKEKPKRMTLLQEWGSSTLRVMSYREVNLGAPDRNSTLGWFRRVISGSTMLIELPLYRFGRVFFRFALAGSEQALRKAGCLLR